MTWSLVGDFFFGKKPAEVPGGPPRLGPRQEGLDCWQFKQVRREKHMKKHMLIYFLYLILISSRSVCMMFEIWWTCFELFWSVCLAVAGSILGVPMYPKVFNRHLEDCTEGDVSQPIEQGLWSTKVATDHRLLMEQRPNLISQKIRKCFVQKQVP